MMIDNSCGGDPGNGGSNCDPSDPTCGNPQPPDQPGCDWNADPTCGGMVGMDSCTNPFAASCGNPWEAQGLPFLSPGLNMSPAADPCVYTNDDGSYNVDPNSSPTECTETEGHWVPDGWQFTVSNTGLVTQTPPTSAFCSAAAWAGGVTGSFGVGFGPLAGGSAPIITELGLGAEVAFGGLAIAPALPYIAVAGLAIWVTARVACH